jgi:hypothetical protein
VNSAQVTQLLSILRSWRHNRNSSFQLMVCAAERRGVTGMNGRIRCVFCRTSTAELPAVDSAQMRCNIREFGDETFTVWRCARCGSLHATEPIDPDRYYQRYATFCRVQLYSFMKVAFRKRIRILKHARLKRGTTLLDYGCGSGHFVRYAREHGVQAGAMILTPRSLGTLPCLTAATSS